MIYIYKLINKDKKKKYSPIEFTLTADNDSAFYKRIRDQYSTPQEDVEILKRIKEEDITDGCIL